MRTIRSGLEPAGRALLMVAFVLILFRFALPRGIGATPEVPLRPGGGRGGNVCVDGDTSGERKRAGIYQHAWFSGYGLDPCRGVSDGQRERGER